MTDRPPLYRTVTRHDISCLSCERCAGYLQEGVAYDVAPEHAASVRRGRCPWCDGRLLLANERPHTIYRPLTAEEMRPNKHGRPPKTARPTPPPQPRSRQHPCVDCDRLVGYRRVRCPGCESAHRATWPRLLEVLADGRRYESSSLCDVLGITRFALRKFIQKARASGHPIRSERNSRREGVYSLEVAS